MPWRGHRLGAVVVPLVLAMFGAGCTRPLGIWQEPQAETDPCADPAGYAEDAPWPTWCRCASRACLAAPGTFGPAAPEVAWRIPEADLGSWPPGSVPPSGSGVIDAAGVLYVLRQNAVVAVAPSGVMRWLAPLEDSEGGYGLAGPLSLTRAGTLVVGVEGSGAWDEAGRGLYLLDPADGAARLVSPTGKALVDVVVGSDGALYGRSRREVVILQPDGELRVRVRCEDDQQASRCSSLGHGPDRGIYLSQFAEWQSEGGMSTLLRVDPAGGVTPFLALEGMGPSLQGLAPDGTLYLFTSIRELGTSSVRVYAVSTGPPAAEAWRAEGASNQGFDGPSLGPDGRRYFVWSEPHYDPESVNRLEAWSADGELTGIWEPRHRHAIVGRPLVDAAGDLYLGTWREGQARCEILSLGPDLAERWRQPCGGDRPPSLLALAPDGTLYVTDGDGLLALRDP